MSRLPKVIAWLSTNKSDLLPSKSINIYKQAFVELFNLFAPSVLTPKRSINIQQTRRTHSEEK